MKDAIEYTVGLKIEDPVGPTALLHFPRFSRPFVTARAVRVRHGRRLE
jgi:hypothetical protein